MAAQQNPLFDLGQQSMLRMIRSARSRLSREQSMEEEKAHARNSASHTSAERSSSLSTAGTASRGSFGGVGRSSRLSRCRPSVEPSENAAPAKAQEAPIRSGGVLGEITNIALGLPQGVENKAREPMHTAKPPLVGPGQMMRESGFGQSLPITNNVRSVDALESDARNAEDPQHVMEYLPDIYRVLQREEANCAVSPGYMELQVHVNAKMRGILVDWLVSVQQKYKLKAETLFLAISLLDRYLELKATARRSLQLVGVTTMLIAAKFEEIYPPQIKDFAYVTDKAYSQDDIINMEVSILSALDFKICRPTPLQFLERYQSVNGCSEAHRDLAQYLLELTLVDYNMLKYSPSRLAAASVLLSNKLLRRQPSWKPACMQHTHFSEQSLKECAKEMCALLEYAEHNPLQAIRKKFSTLKYHSVAKLSFTGASSLPTSTEEAASRPPLGGLDGRRKSVGSNEAAFPSRPSTSSPGAPPPPASSALFDKAGLNMDIAL